MQNKKFPVGMDDFKEIILKNYYYVDKTLFIKELIDFRSKVNLFTRPRRFGKTLNMSMLQYYFEINEEDNESLFAELKIAKAGKMYTNHMGKYPLINLSLKGAKQATFEYALLSIKRAIASEFQRHKTEVLHSENDQERIMRIMDGQGDVGDYLDAIHLLSKCLCQYYDKPVIILIDEYDVPLENAYFEGFYDEMVSFLRSIFESAFKTNKYLEFAILTGCLRISKESIFTGLNNLEIISILNRSYSEHFGFTKQEVETILHTYQLEDKKAITKEWYDGYLFGDVEVYNPWSIIRFVKDSYYAADSLPISYWASTSSNEIVRTMLEKGTDSSTKQELEQLMSGQDVEKPVHEDITYDEIYDTMDNLWNFMFFTGYLKKVREYVDQNGDRFVVLRIPNKEVAYIYRNKISNWFSDLIRSSDLNILYDAVLNKNPIMVQQEINHLLLKTISYEDYQEHFYHGFLLGCLAGMKEFLIKSNRESGTGRSDIILWHPNIAREAIIFELKQTKDSKKLSQECDRALQQITDNDYDYDLLEEGYTNIIKYGIAFYKKSCVVKVIVDV